MFAIAGFYLILFALTLGASFNQLPVWSYGVDAAILVVAAIGTSIWVQGQVVVEWKDGVWMYRLGVVIPAVYLTLFVVRLALDVVVLGIDPFDFTLPSAAPLTGVSLLVVAVVDALFAFSTGLLVGRTVGVYAEYPEARRPGAADRSARPRATAPGRPARVTAPHGFKRGAPIGGP